MSLVSSMNIAQQALSVNQAAITVISNNISNVDTEGYSKLRVNQTAIINSTPSAGNATALAESCSGVKISSVDRYADPYLQSYYRQENSTASYLSEYSTVATNVQNLTNELNGTGLSDALTNFYTAVDSLNSSPNDLTARENYVQQAQIVCTQFNDTATNLNDIQKSLVGDFSTPGSLDSSQISGSVNDVNSLLSQIADVNNGIIKTNSGSNSSSSLLDQRDMLLTKLSALIPADINENSNGTVNVSLGDTDLIKGTKVMGELSVESVNALPPVAVKFTDTNGNTTDVTTKIDSGSIGAMLDVCGSDPNKLTISGVMKNLDAMASNFSSVLNKIQNGDPNSDGTVALAIDKTTKKLIESNPAVNFFVTSDGTAAITAKNISVKSDFTTDPYLVSTARLDKATYEANPTAYENQTGNSTNTGLIVKSRLQSNSSLDDLTLEGYLSGSVASIGSKVSDISTSLTNQKLVLSTVKSNLQAATGVNQDEELVDLVKYQRAYQAAARVFSVCNDLLGELVNLGK